MNDFSKLCPLMLETLHLIHQVLTHVTLLMEQVLKFLELIISPWSLFVFVFMWIFINQIRDLLVSLRDLVNRLRKYKDFEFDPPFQKNSGVEKIDSKAVEEILEKIRLNKIERDEAQLQELNEQNKQEIKKYLLRLENENEKLKKDLDGKLQVSEYTSNRDEYYSMGMSGNYSRSLIAGLRCWRMMLQLQEITHTHTWSARINYSVQLAGNKSYNQIVEFSPFVDEARVICTYVLVAAFEDTAPPVQANEYRDYMQEIAKKVLRFCDVVEAI